MGLFDGVAGQLLGSVLGGQQGGQSAAGGNPLLQAVMQLIQNQPGGLAGLLQKFQQAGLGEQVASWIGTGSNQPVSGEQVHAALGGDTIAAIAGQLGLSHADTAGGLANLLPQLVDHLTPQGQVSEGAELQSMLTSLAGKFLGA